jgi:hypothetical protein
MHGKFTYKRNQVAGGHDIYYQGPFDTDRRLLCTTVKVDRKWSVPLPSGSLGPFRDRWHAGYAYLEHLLVEPAKTLNAKVRSQWADLNLQRREPRILHEDFAGKIYDILVEKCRAPADGKSSFVYVHTQRAHAGTEWRFGGLLGSGGKFRNHRDRLYVDCYIEDEDPEKLTFIAETNEAIFCLWQQFYSAVGVTSA